jgi:hypothetical protein
MATKKTAKKKAPAKKKVPAKKVAPSRTVASKKVAKKKAVKKTVARTAKAKRKECTFCQNGVASQDQCFWVYNGPVVDSVPHLIEAMRHMNQDQFDYHVKGDRNDFAAWVRDVFGCEMCSKQLASVRSRSAAIKILEEACVCGKK